MYTNAVSVPPTHETLLVPSVAFRYPMRLEVKVPPAALVELFAPKVGAAPFQLRLLQQVPLLPSATLRPPESLQVDVRVAASFTLNAVLPKEVVPV